MTNNQAPPLAKEREMETIRGINPQKPLIGGVNIVFEEPIYNVMSKINDKPFFKWPKVMPSDPS